MKRALRWLWRTFCKVALVGLCLIGAAGALLAPGSTTAFAEQTPAQSQAARQIRDEAPTPQERERARQRSRQGRLLFLGSLLYEGILIIGFLVLGGTRWLAKIVARFGGRWAPALAVVAAVLSIGGALLTFPLDYYAGFTFPHQYGLSNQTTLQWLRDYLVGEGVSVALGLPLLMLLYLVLRRAPRTWWIWMGAASVPVTIFVMLISPVFIAPLFNKFTPLRDETLRREILAMAREQGIEAEDVYQMDASRQGKTVNAYVNGFGPTQRIVLYDTLLENFTHEEIKFVMAHEMGHYVLGHIRQGMMLAIFGAFASGFALYKIAGWLLTRFGGFLGFTSLGNPASYPLLIALGMGLSLIALLAGNAYSRHLEWQADRYALETYPHPEAGISAFHKLARYNVSEENPPRWAEVLLHSHPSLARRIAALEQARE